MLYIYNLDIFLPEKEFDTRHPFYLCLLYACRSKLTIGYFLNVFAIWRNGSAKRRDPLRDEGKGSKSTEEICSIQALYDF